MKGKGSEHCQFAWVRLAAGYNGSVGIFLKPYTAFVKAESGIEAYYEYLPTPMAIGLENFRVLLVRNRQAIFLAVH